MLRDTTQLSEPQPNGKCRRCCFWYQSSTLGLSKAAAAGNHSRIRADSRLLSASSESAPEVLKDWAWKWCLSHARHDPVKLSQGRVRSPIQKRTRLAQDFHQTLYSLQNPPWISCCALESSPASRVPHWEVGREWVPKRVRKLQFSQPLSASTQYLKRSIIPWGAFGVVGLNCFIWIHSQPHLQRAPRVPGRKEPRWGGLPDAARGGTAEPR